MPLSKLTRRGPPASATGQPGVHRKSWAGRCSSWLRIVSGSADDDLPSLGSALCDEELPSFAGKHGCATRRFLCRSQRCKGCSERVGPRTWTTCAGRGQPSGQTRDHVTVPYINRDCSMHQSDPADRTVRYVLPALPPVFAVDELVGTTRPCPLPALPRGSHVRGISSCARNHRPGPVGCLCRLVDPFGDPQVVYSGRERVGQRSTRLIPLEALGSFRLVVAPRRAATTSGSTADRRCRRRCSLGKLLEPLTVSRLGRFPVTVNRLHSPRPPCTGPFGPCRHLPSSKARS